MRGAIAWFARNSVAANLLMAVVICGGLVTVPRLKLEVFPEIDTELINVSVEYLGAAPEEVEEGICVRIEEALEGLEGIKEISSVANEGLGIVTVEALTGTDIRELLSDVQARVDTIDTFPEETEKPVIQQVIPRRQVINVAISGDTDEASLKHLGEGVRDEIGALPGITQVELVNVRPYEISIEVSERDLRRYGLTFDEVATAIRRSSLDLPGGSIKTSGGEILLRTKGQAYRGRDFERLVLRSRSDGTRLLLADVARVVDGFAETDQFAHFDGKPSVMVRVFRVGNQSALEIAATVKDYVEQARLRMPAGISLTTWQDFTVLLRSRLELLTRNGIQGFILVFIVLTIFLKLRLSIWVCVGIPLSFLGTLWLMPALGASINLLSLFAFIVVLGIVVDDAIIVGEGIYSHQERGGSYLEGSIVGAQTVVTPVTFAVLTSVASFAPLLFVSGDLGKIMRTAPLIVIPTFLFSLLESIFILPAHLSHRVPDGVLRAARVLLVPLGHLQSLVSWGLRLTIQRVYRPVLEFCLSWRYLAAASAISTLLLTLGLERGGWIRFTFFPPVEDDNVAAILTLPQGTPARVTANVIQQLEESAFALRRELEAERGPGDSPVFRHILTSIGDQPYRSAQSQRGGKTRINYAGGHRGEVHIELAPSEERAISSSEIADRWRQKTGPIADVVELVYSSSMFSPDPAIDIRLTGPDMERLRDAARDLKDRLASYPAVYDITDSFREGKKEVKLDILPSAEPLGLTLADLGRQVRQAFYGEEAQRVQRGRDDIKVMVRYPASRRRSLGDLDDLRVRTGDGGDVPFATVARARHGRGSSTIQRVDHRRSIDVRADVDVTRGNANEVIQELRENFFTPYGERHPGVFVSFEGEQREQRESLADLGRGFIIALFVIYALLAIPFGSYVQPLMILLAIPFGLVGAIWGHAIMGMDLTIVSVFGFVALTGIVVNDSLVLVDRINCVRREGASLAQAVREGGAARFRPILLTSLTTFAGLSPLLFERSLQAQFLVPMAISIAFGVIFSTFITLILVPASYLILEDVRAIPRLLAGTRAEGRP